MTNNYRSRDYPHPYAWDLQRFYFSAPTLLEELERRISQLPTSQFRTTSIPTFTSSTFLRSLLTLH